MMELSSAAVWAFGVVQFLGWSVGFLSRFSAGSRYQSAFHAFFMLTLLAVGAFTALSVLLGTKCWLLSATTLAGMILLAICDFDRSRRPATI
jgi:hypothetical protein